MKKMILFTLAFFMMISFCFAQSKQEISDFGKDQLADLSRLPITEIEQEIDTLNQQLQAVRNQKADLEEEYSALNKQKAQKEKEISSLKDQTEDKADALMRLIYPQFIGTCTASNYITEELMKDPNWKIKEFSFGERKEKPGEGSAYTRVYYSFIVTSTSGKKEIILFVIFTLNY